MPPISSRSRSGWAQLAGLLLLLDGLAALLLGTLIVVLFRPVAAIEGRPSPDQTQYWVLVPTVLFAIGCFWAGQRAIRGIRRGRVVGVMLAGMLGLLSGWLITASTSVPEFATTAGLLLPQVLIVVALLRWPEAARPDPPGRSPRAGPGRPARD